MSSKILTGLERLANDPTLSKQFSGNVGLLCHSASITSKYRHAAEVFTLLFGDRFKKIYGPQHGFVTDVQDNMVETKDFIHPFFKRPIHSLYSHTRIPTDEMLEGIDHIFVDLQDVGTRIYTYIYTMTLLLEKCAEKDIEVVILDRPNPINARDVEGNVLDLNFASFVGRHEIPVRHGLTIAEVALMHQKYWAKNPTKLTIVEMQGYQRSMTFWDTKLPYINPSPNLPTVEGCFTFVGTVLLEGTSLSEGRGTTRPLEVIGHPQFEPWKHQKFINERMQTLKLEGFVLRPLAFFPMFQKHEHQGCGGYFIHITDYNKFKPWRTVQHLVREFRQLLPHHFHYKTDPYEYEKDMNPLDMINGTDRLRNWLESTGNDDFLEQIESEGLPDYLSKREEIVLYK